MSDEKTVDRHLAAVYDDVLVALYRTKQVAWSASSTVFGTDLRILRDFLIEQSRLVDEAETRIGGRAERLSTPSSHQQGNLVAESGGDLIVAVRTLAKHLAALQWDVRERAARMSRASWNLGDGPVLITRPRQYRTSV